MHTTSSVTNFILNQNSIIINKYKITEMKKIILIALLSLCFKLSYSQSKEIPTASNCGCLEKIAQKQTSKSNKIGFAYIYTNGVVFKFNSTIKTFYHLKGEFYQTPKGDIYRRQSADNKFYFQVKKTIYSYEQ